MDSLVTIILWLPQRLDSKVAITSTGSALVRTSADEVKSTCINCQAPQSVVKPGREFFNI